MFQSALEARSLASVETPRYVLTVTLLRSDTTDVPGQPPRPPAQQAHVTLHVALTSVATGQPVYADDKAVTTDTSVIALNAGPSAGPAARARLIEETLGQAVDATLDASAFRAALLPPA
jgi:hypothetical protein